MNASDKNSRKNQGSGPASSVDAPSSEPQHGFGHNSGDDQPEPELSPEEAKRRARQARRWSNPAYVQLVERFTAAIKTAVEAPSNLDLMSPREVGALGDAKPLERKRIIDAAKTLALHRLFAEPKLLSKSHAGAMEYIAIRSDNEHGRCLDSMQAIARYLKVRPDSAREIVAALRNHDIVLCEERPGSPNAHWLPYPRKLLDWQDGLAPTSQTIIDAISEPGRGQRGRPKKPVGQADIDPDAIPQGTTPGGIEPEKPLGTVPIGLSQKPLGTVPIGLISENKPLGTEAKTPGHRSHTAEAHNTSSVEAEDVTKVTSLEGCVTDGSSTSERTGRLSSFNGAVTLDAEPSLPDGACSVSAVPIEVGSATERKEVRKEVKEGPPHCAAPSRQPTDILIKQPTDYIVKAASATEPVAVIDLAGLGDRERDLWLGWYDWKSDTGNSRALRVAPTATPEEAMRSLRGTIRAVSANSPLDVLQEALPQAFEATDQNVRSGKVQGSPCRYFTQALKGLIHQNQVERIRQAAELKAAAEIANAEVAAKLDKIDANKAADLAIAARRPELFDAAAQGNATRREAQAADRTSRNAQRGSKIITGADGRERFRDEARVAMISRTAIEGRDANVLLDEFASAMPRDIEDVLKLVDAEQPGVATTNRGTFVNPPPVLKLIDMARQRLPNAVAFRLHGTPVAQCGKPVAKDANGKPIANEWFAARSEWIDALAIRFDGLAEFTTKESHSRLTPPGASQRADPRAFIAERVRATTFPANAAELYGSDFHTNFCNVVKADLSAFNDFGLKKRAEREACEQRDAENKRRAELRVERLAAFNVDFPGAFNHGGAGIKDAFGRPMLADPVTRQFIHADEAVRFGADIDLLVRTQKRFSDNQYSTGWGRQSSHVTEAAWDALSKDEVRALIETQRAHDANPEPFNATLERPAAAPSPSGFNKTSGHPEPDPNQPLRFGGTTSGKPEEQEPRALHNACERVTEVDAEVWAAKGAQPAKTKPAAFSGINARSFRSTTKPWTPQS